MVQSNSPDSGLVLATYALQLGLLSREQLCQALQFWLQDTSQALAQVLVTHRYLSEEDRRTLAGLVERHLQQGAAVVEESLRLFQPLPAAQPTSGDVVDKKPRPAGSPEELARSMLRTLREDGSAGERNRRIPLSVLNVSHERFRVLRPYAMGGLGVVSIAHDIELDREVAIKEMLPGSDTSAEEFQRFLLEARLTGQLDHPGIPPVYALGYFEDGRPFYVMRLIEGQTLRDGIKAFHSRYPFPQSSPERTLELRQLLGSIVSVCNTLRFAHSRGILHRDIKPSNIMLGEYGETIVLDWGLAKTRQQSKPLSMVDLQSDHGRHRVDDDLESETGSVMGTPHYMSPEQAKGEMELVNVRSDVYSVGATLYHLLTGKAPYSGLSRDEIFEQLKRGQLTRPRTIDPRIPPDLEAICLKAMAIERSERFAHTGEVAAELERWLADEPVGCYQEPLTKLWGRWLRARRVLVAALMVLMVTSLLGMIVGTAFVAWERSQAIKQADLASQAQQRAEQLAEESRDVISKWLILGYNSRVEQIRGTESGRLEFLNKTLPLLAKRAADVPYDVTSNVDWALALGERARLEFAQGNLDKTWQDFTEALAILRDLKEPVKDTDSGYVRFNQLYMMIDLAEFLLSTEPNSIRTQEQIAQVTYAARVHYENQPTATNTQIGYSRACILQAKWLRQREPVGALEHASRATTILSCIDLATNLFDDRIVDVQRHVRELACLSEGLEASIAAQLHCTSQALERAHHSLSASLRLRKQNPELVNLKLHEFQMRWLICKLDNYMPGKTSSNVQSLRALLAEVANSEYRSTELAMQVRLELARTELAMGHLLLAKRLLSFLGTQELQSNLEAGAVSPDIALEGHQLLVEAARLEGDVLGQELHEFRVTALRWSPSN